MDTPLQPSTFQNLETLLLLTFDENANRESKDYFLTYNKKLIFIILKIVEQNKSITINQVCGLLRNTLQVPDNMTRTMVQAMLSGIDSIQNLNKVVRAFPTKRGAVHLNLVGDLIQLESWTSPLLEEFPELISYSAPTYQKGPIFKKGS